MSKATIEKRLEKIIHFTKIPKVVDRLMWPMSYMDLHAKLISTNRKLKRLLRDMKEGQ